MTDRDIHAQYNRWIENATECSYDELASLAEDEDALADAFFRDLAFGTGGLRGVVGPGPNRMNTYTVGKATQGLANYLNERFDAPSVAIARDSRIGGELFSRIAAEVLAANGIKACLYPRIEPTPALSFAVRDLGCSAGICVTASHNPAEYNGYKVYGPDGCQITTQVAHDIQEAINAVDVFDDVARADFYDEVENGTINWIGEGTLRRFINAVLNQSLEAPAANAQAPLSVVYTPLNGTGLECFERMVKRIGVTGVRVVPEQANPDGRFPTCPYPNPEVRDALQKGLDLCRRAGADLLIASDPDADRIGIAAPQANGEIALITGNELGILLLDYICRMRIARGESLSDKIVITTIVSSDMIDAMAQHYGFELRRTLTGFKYIGAQIGMLEDEGGEDRFIFGFEESYGYLSGPHVRDKDAINAAMLVCQMVRELKAQGKTIFDALEGIYQTYGYHRNGQVSVSYPGAAGAELMAKVMRDLREQPPAEIAGFAVENRIDYAHGMPMPTVNAREDDEPQVLPDANVIEFDLCGGNKVIVRPSGTEPKIKSYLFANADVATDADTTLEHLSASVRDILG